VEAMRSGLPQKTVAEETGLSRETLRTLAREHGLPDGRVRRETIKLPMHRTDVDALEALVTPLGAVILWGRWGDDPWRPLAVGLPTDPEKAKACREIVEKWLAEGEQFGARRFHGEVVGADITVTMHPENGDVDA